MTDTWESAGIVVERWESSTTPGYVFNVIVRDGDIVATVSDEQLAAAIAAYFDGSAPVREGDGAGGALSGTYPNPGLNTDALAAWLNGLIVAGENIETVFDPGPDEDPPSLTISATGGSTGYGLASPERISARPQSDTPIVSYNTDDWDDNEIREPGQAIYDPVTGLWILPYTGEDSATAYTQIGAVLSDDGGETWTAHPQNPIGPLETDPAYSGVVTFDDPYVAKTVDGEVWRDALGRAHIYVEEKDGLTHQGIGLWTSAANTLDDWEYQGQVLGPGDTGAWDETDRTSPVVIFDGTQLNMLFEGRNLATTVKYDEWDIATTYNQGDIVWTNPLSAVFWRCLTDGTIGTSPDVDTANWEPYYGQLGQTGHAVSTDEGVTWTPHGSNPVIATTEPGTWGAVSIVIDDAIKVGGEWIALVHGLDTHDGTYVVGRFRTSDEPADWNEGSFTECVGNPYDTATNTVTCWGNDPTQAVVIRQLDVNPGVGERLERSYVTPTVGVTDDGGTPFDPSGLQGQITTLGERVDGHDIDILNLLGMDLTIDGRLDGHDTDILNLLAADLTIDERLDGHDTSIAALTETDNELLLLIGRTSPRTTATAFDVDTGDFGGAGLDGTTVMTLPDARLVVDHTTAPWPPVGSNSAAAFSPGAATASHRLIGAKVRLAVDGSTMTDVAPVVGLLDADDFTNVAGRVAVSGDGWTQLVGGFTLVSASDLAAAQTEHEVVLVLDVPLDGPTAAELMLTVGFGVLGGAPSIDAGTAIDVASVEWLWDTDQPAADPPAGWTTIADVTVGVGGAASVEVSSLDDWDDIEIDWFARSSASGAAEAVMLARFNGDTGNNYNRAVFARSGNATVSSNATGQSAGGLGQMSGSQTNTNRMAAGKIHVQCQQPAASRKVAHGSFVNGQSTSDNVAGGQWSMEWTNTTDALSTLTLFPLSGSFVEGSRFVVRGRTA